MMRRFLRMGAAVATLCCGGGVLAQTKPEPIDPAGWVTHEDYPAEGLLSRLSGVVEVEVAVDAKGGATGCSTIKSSGSEILDNAACAALMARARFKPAQDATGQPVAGTYLRRVRWQMPDRPLL